MFIEQPDLGRILSEYYNLTYPTCKFWEGLEGFIARERTDKTKRFDVYVAVPLKHPWFKKPEFKQQKPFSCTIVNKQWALFRFKVRYYSDRIRYTRHLDKKLHVLVREAVKAEGWKDR